MASSLLTDLIVREEIETTLKKAKFLKPLCESFLAKLRSDRPELVKRRFSIKSLTARSAVDKSLQVLADKKLYPKLFVSISRIGARRGDGAPLARLVLSGKLPLVQPAKVESEVDDRSKTGSKNGSEN